MRGQYEFCKIGFIWGKKSQAILGRVSMVYVTTSSKTCNKRCYCIKNCAKAINIRALASKKSCINKEFHAPLIHRSLTFHLHDSGQYSINTEEAPSLQLKRSIKQFTEELCRFGYCAKMTEPATLNENVGKNDLNL